MRRCFLLVAMILVSSGGEAHKPVTSKYNYSEDVFPILNQRCGGCHAAGGVAPMSLLTYRDALPWAESMRLELTAAHMPPWYAENGYGELKHTHRLSPRELDTLLTWATGGTPEGPPRRLAAVNLKSEWKMGQPDLVIPMPAPFTLGPGQMEETEEFVLATAPADRWVRAVDLLPGAPAMVREATIYVRSGETLGLWLPADDAVATPPGAAFRWPAGAALLLRIHYRKTWTYEDKSVSDRSTVGLYLAKGPSAAVSGVEIGPEFTLLHDMQALAIRVEGGPPDTVLQVEAISPRGVRTALVSLLCRPEWNRRYWFARPLTLVRGTQIKVTGGTAERMFIDVVE